MNEHPLGWRDAPTAPDIRSEPTVGEPFLSFHAHYGEALCGRPVTEVLVEGGRRCQYFEHVALEELDGGRVRLKPLGRAWVEARRATPAAPADRPPRPPVLDVSLQLVRHPSRTYPKRPLGDIRYIVLHHTAASRDVGASQIAEEHVRVNDWPGIGYHFVIDPAGTILRCQDLTTVSHHARQFNPVAVGVALMGDLSATLPTIEQMDAAADLTASLLADLGLPPCNVRGHREMVDTPCPGDTFLAVWKPRLMREVAARLEPSPPARAALDPPDGP